MKNINRSRGFTLIELLVVIAIIGILSGVVLASLNTARDKGNDAAIQQDLSTVTTQAEIYYGDNSNSYGTQAWTASAGATNPCTAGMFAETTINKALIGANTANGTSLNLGCASTASTYVVAAALNTSTASYWCIDNTGVSKKVVAAFPSTLATCP